MPYEKEGLACCFMQLVQHTHSSKVISSFYIDDYVKGSHVFLALTFQRASSLHGSSPSHGECLEKGSLLTLMGLKGQVKPCFWQEKL